MSQTRYRLTKKGKTVVIASTFALIAGLMWVASIIHTQEMEGATLSISSMTPSVFPSNTSRKIAHEIFDPDGTPPIEKELPATKLSHVDTDAEEDYSLSLLAEQKRSAQIFRRNPEAGKQVALTFDDGPYPVWTAEYLKVLEEYHVLATFFLVGIRAEKYPQLVKKIVAKQCEVGSHSYQHAQLTLKNQQALTEDFQKTITAFKKAGQEISLFRPPYGVYDRVVLDTAETFGQIGIGWNVDPQDWNTKQVDLIVSRILSRVTPGSIILLHEGRKSTWKALPKILSGLEQKGYQLVTVSQFNSAPAVKQFLHTEVSAIERENIGY